MRIYCFPAPLLAALAGLLLAGCATVSDGTPATYPSYNTAPIPPDFSGMADTAAQTASRLGLGFNIGNTLEATGGRTETYWGNPRISPQFVKFVKDSGFGAVRLPVSWDQYADQTTAKIDAAWLNRVKEVVQECVDNGLYVIVNIHWDGGWLEQHVDAADQVSVNAKQKAYWEQIATQLRDFDAHVLFAGSNEPNVATAEQMAVLLSYHQSFIDAVRATGGRNAYRTLVVQGPSTDIGQTGKLMDTLPADTVPDRIMVEVHYYTPWNFTGMTKDESWGNQFYYWGQGYHSTSDPAHNPTWGEEDTVDSSFQAMKNQFGSRGIPVIIGEFGAQLRTNLGPAASSLHLASRAYYFRYVTQKAVADGLVPFVWDTGHLLSRTGLVVQDQAEMDALLQGAGGP